ncbi:MAG: DUF423 domain-containing protein [Cytophagales bacterium]|nr:MAG: DUF423 domain-containing protein [Cytophagales bacterium]
MAKFFLLSGALLSALGVMIGAFGAHALKETLTQYQRLETFETGVRYHFYHALALCLLGILLGQYSHKFLHYAGYCFLAGIVFFSGALYVLSLTNIKILGAIAPIGGTAFIAGWLLLAWAVFKQ